VLCQVLTIGNIARLPSAERAMRVSFAYSGTALHIASIQVGEWKNVAHGEE
jgi:hypothetical protein